MPGLIAGGAVASAHLGDRVRAMAWAAQAMVLDPGDRVTLYNVVCAYALLGDVEPALDMLETLAAYSGPEQVEWFAHHSDLDALRLHPRFLRLFSSIAS